MPLPLPAARAPCHPPRAYPEPSLQPLLTLSAQIGGATGLVGDPSGRNTERPLAESEVVATNVDHLVAGINKFFEGAIAYAKKRVDSTAAEAVTAPAVRNNLDWFQGIGLLQFLRTVGINARVNTMLARERCALSVLIPESEADSVSAACRPA